MVWYGVIWCDKAWLSLVVSYRVKPSWLAGVVAAVLCLDLGEAQLGDRPAGVVAEAAQLPGEVNQHLKQQLLTRNISGSKSQSFKCRRWGGGRWWH